MSYLTKTLNDFELFFNRKQLQKVNFTEKCKNIIQQKMSFDDALLQLPEFIETVEILKGQNKIAIDNNFGKFLAVWDDNGKNLTYFEFRTRRF